MVKESCIGLHYASAVYAWWYGSMSVRPSAAPSVMQLIFWQRGFLQLILHYSQGNLGSPKMKVILSGTWSQILHSTINKLHRVQNNAARIVLQMSKRTHAKPLLEKLHWLPVRRTARQLRDSRAHFQNSEHVDSGISQPPHPHTSTHSRHSVINDSSDVRADHLHQDQLRQARLPLLGFSCLELATQDSAWLCQFVNF